MIHLLTANDNCYFLGDVTHTMVVSPALSELPLDHRSDQAVDASHSSAHSPRPHTVMIIKVGEITF